MLALKGQELGLEMHVLSPQASDPAAQVTRHWHQGSPDHAEDLASFFRQVDVVTVESEFHEATSLASAEKSSGTKLFPSAQNLGTLQDRLPQKDLLKASGLRTAPFFAVDTWADMDRAFEAFKGAFVLKKRRGGYDGYGTFIVRSKKDLERLKISFDPTQSPCIAEAFVPFVRELALVVARNPQGEIAVLPLVETHQVDSRLDWLKGPVRHPGLKTLQKGLEKFLKKIDYVGTIAFELFETKDRLLWINEVAPRVHNSGHYSLEAVEMDQFRLHLMAILGKSLTAELSVKAFAMTNLIGSGAATPEAPENLTGHLHWYGKNESRKGRKMGHVTYVGASSSALLKKALKERKGFKL
ncbi:MAG: ATP-grasp domain-containing protein [Bdellovibrionaceae bacterium]|nr:ATP-grasp domain-containing protein [Pseudobdellovibrionaceae bacterium]